MKDLKTRKDEALETLRYSMRSHYDIYNPEELEKALRIHKLINKLKEEMEE